jgi:hypothetical protein
MERPLKTPPNILELTNVFSKVSGYKPAKKN